MNITHENCKLVVFSNKAWNAIVSETLRKDPVETGGIMLGHILSNGYWIVMEVVPPGLKTIHQRAYFEYDTDFVNYMSYSISKQYKMELAVLGLWHRHPGSMDVFSGTDDGTNSSFAQMNAYGAISGLVNIDPKLRFTLRHVTYPLHYQTIDFEVGDDLIPPQYFELKYSYGEDLVPLAHIVPTVNEESSNIRIAEPDKNGNNSHQKSPDNDNHEFDIATGNNREPFYLKYKKLLYVIVPFSFLFIGVTIGYTIKQVQENSNFFTAEKTDKRISELEEYNKSQNLKIKTLSDSIDKLNSQLKELPPKKSKK